MINEIKNNINTSELINFLNKTPDNKIFISNLTQVKKIE